MNDILEVRHLVKHFGDVTAVDDLSFRVREGELFAFLGVNGAGKSTTIHILCGQLARDGGSVRVCGADPDEAPEQLRRSLGVVFQSSVLDQALSVQENLRSRAALYGIRGTAFSRRLAELTDLLELGELLRRPVGKLSGGQRRRIDIARALLHRPRLLILDEPTTGLDPQTRSLLWQVVAGLRQEENLTVFLTTHYMEEVEQICTRIAIMDKGRNVALGTKDELKAMIDLGETIQMELSDFSEEISDAVRALPHVINVSFENGLLKVRFSKGKHNLLRLLDLLKDKEIVFGNVHSELPTLNDVFLEITGKELRD